MNERFNVRHGNPVSTGIRLECAQLRSRSPRVCSPCCVNWSVVLCGVLCRRGGSAGLWRSSRAGADDEPTEWAAAARLPAGAPMPARRPGESADRQRETTLS